MRGEFSILLLTGWLALWGCGSGHGGSKAPASEAARSGDAVGEARQCADRNPLRNAYFGELHVHTVNSMDAYTWDVRATPDDAYRFARGEAIPFPPLGADGVGLRSFQLERPIDFAAVTDHASFLGPVAVCTDPNSPGYQSQGCDQFRGNVAADSPFGEMGARMAGFYDAPSDPSDASALLARRDFSTAVCGPDGASCRNARAQVWDEIQAAAERWNDTSDACVFTAFKAYEYTATPNMTKIHRNVIFRNSAVPPQPIAWLDAGPGQELFRQLELQCLDANTGCDALTIPHNSNLSNGRLFGISYREDPVDLQLVKARRRARLERLAEISQIKGDSECRNGLHQVLGGEDELCNYEKMRAFSGRPPEDCEDGQGDGALAGMGCQSRLDFVRYALVEGLLEAERLGVNPVQVGIVAATDAHNANPGDTQERTYAGWSGKQDDTVMKRLGAGDDQGGVAGQRWGLSSNPGGLAGVWAEQNSRDSLFDAMQARETFGTSGPRIQPRFFGGYGYAADLCGAPDFLAKGYAGGVPMGGELSRPPAGAEAPVFAGSALRDPGTSTFPGGLLQRIQIVKGWADDEGRFHQAVYDVAGSADNGASVDPATCEPRGPGHDSLCAVWGDPDFDPNRHAVYYARVVENPSCRWNAWQCLELPEAERPSSCSDPAIPQRIQERAWTSPIWYVPS